MIDEVIQNIADLRNVVNLKFNRTINSIKTPPIRQ